MLTPPIHHRSVVNRWLMDREKGGTGGLVPAHHMAVLLQKAPDLGIELTPDDFAYLPPGDAGRPESHAA